MEEKKEIQTALPVPIDRYRLLEEIKRLEPNTTIKSLILEGIDLVILKRKGSLSEAIEARAEDLKKTLSELPDE